MSVREALYQAIDKDQGELFELLGSLIQINSENFATHGNEKECAEYVKKYFDDLGYEADIYSPLDIPNFEKHPDHFGNRKLEDRRNCTVCVPGEKHDKKLMLASHIDTVEIGDLSKWNFPPLCGKLEDGKILGRGACDDKYGVAACMFLIKKLKELGIKLNYDLLFSGYCDEERAGSHGALAACLKYPCDDYLNLDCKNFEIWNCGVGGGNLIFRVSSKKTVDNCDNAIAGLNIVKEKIEEFRAKRRAELEANPHFKGTIVARNACRIMVFSVGGSGGTDMGDGFIRITYYTDKTEPVIMAELAELKKEIDVRLEEFGLGELIIEKPSRFFHYVTSDEDNCIINMLQEAGKENGRELRTIGACLSDLPMFVLYGSPRAVSFGIGADFDRPGGAHQVNEYVECDKLIEFTKIVASVILKYNEQ